ncbi:hypothetical protein HC928_07225 [bacterium]|nr:hypothetical protein [bacterium]
MNTPATHLKEPDFVYITRSALQHIEEEARHPRSQQPNLENETGGVLFGRRISLENGQSAMLIIEATGPGPKAFFHEVEFNPDVEYANEQLHRFRQDYPNCDYIGTWHKHPSSYRRYSMGDVKTAHQIFSDESYKLDEIINPIVWVDGGKFTIQYYYMNRGIARQGQEFIQVTSKTRQLEDSDPLVQDERKAQPAQPYPPRIVKEVEALRSESYNIEIHQDGSDFIFTVTDPDHPVRSVYLVVGPDYPQNPPQVVVEDNGQQIPTDADRLVQQWNPDRYLVDLANCAFRPAQAQLKVIPPPSYQETEQTRHASEMPPKPPQPPRTPPPVPNSSQSTPTPILLSALSIVTLLLLFAIGYIVVDIFRGDQQTGIGDPSPVPLNGQASQPANSPADSSADGAGLITGTLNPAFTPTVLPTNTPLPPLNTEQYQALWKVYAESLSRATSETSKENWNAVVTALDVINGFIGENPELLEQMNNTEPRTPDSERLRIEARLEYAKTLLAAGDYEAATAQYGKVVDSNTYSGDELARIRLEYAEALQKKGDQDAATAQCDAVKEEAIEALTTHATNSCGGPLPTETTTDVPPATPTATDVPPATPTAQ